MKKILSVVLMLMCISMGASAATKCKATTQKGTQCTRVAVKDGYCKQHYKHSTKCQATTQTGKRCTRKAIKDGYCAQHYNHLVNNETKYEGCFKNGKPVIAANEAEQCQATTKKGERCKLKVVEGTNFCPTHTK